MGSLTSGLRYCRHRNQTQIIMKVWVLAWNKQDHSWRCVEGFGISNQQPKPEKHRKKDHWGRNWNQGGCTFFPRRKILRLITQYGFFFFIFTVVIKTSFKLNEMKYKIRN